MDFADFLKRTQALAQANVGAASNSLVDVAREIARAYGDPTAQQVMLEMAVIILGRLLAASCRPADPEALRLANPDGAIFMKLLRECYAIIREHAGPGCHAILIDRSGSLPRGDTNTEGGARVS